MLENDAGAGNVQWVLLATQLCAAGGELGGSGCRATESRMRAQSAFIKAETVSFRGGIKRARS